MIMLRRKSRGLENRYGSKALAKGLSPHCYDGQAAIPPASGKTYTGSFGKKTVKNRISPLPHITKR
jgi:hypothetical protein